MILALVLCAFLREPRRGEAEAAGGERSGHSANATENLSLIETLRIIFRTPAVPLLMLAFGVLLKMLVIC